MHSNVKSLPLRYYHMNWWKVESAGIYYLAGKDYEDPLHEVGWYYEDETGGLNGPYNFRKEAEDELEKYRYFL